MHPIADILSPPMDRSHNDGTYKQFIMWKRKYILILGCQLKAVLDSCKARSMLQWSDDHGIKVYNGGNISGTLEDTLGEYWHSWNELPKLTQANDTHIP